jgi:hypothetical protein
MAAIDESGTAGYLRDIVATLSRPFTGTGRDMCLKTCPACPAGLSVGKVLAGLRASATPGHTFCGNEP